MLLSQRMMVRAGQEKPSHSYTT